MTYWQMPQRAGEERVLGGVASGLASEVGVDPVWIRLAFIALFALGGWGALLYLVLFGAISLADHRGLGPSSEPVPKGRSARHRLAGVALITAGLALFVRGLVGLPPAVIWPLGILGAGVVVALRRTEPGIHVSQLVGAVVAAIGVFAFVQAADIGPSVSPSVVAAVAVVGLFVLSAPWWWRLVADLDAERQARIRSDERADVAAHLHDSVLQTLTLIQNGLNDDTADPQRLAALARQQERELRNWLDPDRADRTGGSVRGRLDQIASEVEAIYGTPVEVVCVGDVIVDEPIEVLLAAGREAAMNAARHSGTDRIDLYAEVGDAIVELFVRDTGKGFDPQAVSTDRRGLSQSIAGRMERAGGTAVIHTEIGQGTEVELSIARRPSVDRTPEARRQS